MYSLTGLLKKLSRDGSVPMVFYNESHLFATESMAKILKFAGEYETPMTYFAKGSDHVEKNGFPPSFYADTTSSITDENAE